MRVLHALHNILEDGSAEVHPSINLPCKWSKCYRELVVLGCHGYNLARNLTPGSPSVSPTPAVSIILKTLPAL